MYRTEIENEHLTDNQGITLQCKCGCKKVKLISETYYGDRDKSVNLYLVCKHKDCGHKQWLYGYYADY